MTKTIESKFLNTKCKQCERKIPQGSKVQWTKGERGVLCLTCAGTAAVYTDVPTAPTAPTASNTEVAAYIAELTNENMFMRESAALSGATVARQLEIINAQRDVLDAQGVVIAELRARLALLQPAAEQSVILDAILDNASTTAHDTVAPDAAAYDDECPI